MYFDGQSARACAVRVWVSPGGELLWADADGQITAVAPGQFQVRPALAGVVRRIECGGGRLLEVADTDWVDRCLPQRGVQAIVARWEARTSRVWLVLLSGIVMLVLAWRTLLPWVETRIVAAVPWSVEQALGRQVLPLLGQLQMSASTLPESRQAGLRARFQTLCARLGPGPACVLEFRNGPINAFALPGGIVVLTDPLVHTLEDDDLIVAVMAHELGHVRARDGLHTLVRGTALSVGFAALTGDLTTFALGGGAEALALLGASHSREVETRADRDAIELLRAEGLAPTAYLRALEQLFAARGQDAGGWWSSHPADSERMAAARAAAGQH